MPLSMTMAGRAVASMSGSSSCGSPARSCLVLRGRRRGTGAGHRLPPAAIEASVPRGSPRPNRGGGGLATPGAGASDSGSGGACPPCARAGERAGGRRAWRGDGGRKGGRERLRKESSREERRRVDLVDEGSGKAGGFALAPH